MAIFYRLGNKTLSKINSSKIDEYLIKLGFIYNNEFNYYYKDYNTNFGDLKLGVICGNNNIYDLMAVAKSNDTKYISNFEKIYECNAKAISSLDMIKTSASYGPEGGLGVLHNINLDENLGGPRWWQYKDDDGDLNELESWLQHQPRYNPQYFQIGQPLQIGQDEYTILGTIKDNVKFARLNNDRQEVYLEYINDNNEINKIKISLLKDSQESGKYDGDLSQDLKKYKLKILKGNNEFIILIRKTDTRGDIRGIWEINGRDSTPGVAYIDEDFRTSYSLHPELLDDPVWTNGGWSPGRNNYDQGMK